MKFDNFNTARCRICGTIKQYQPGVEYQPKDFNCICTEKEAIRDIEAESKPKRIRQKGNTDGNSGPTTKKD